MPHDASDELTWTALRERLEGDGGPALAEWCRAFASAVLSRDLARCDRLLDESFVFPSESADLIARLRDGARALRSGRRQDAIERMAIGSPLAGDMLQPLAEGGPAAGDAPIEADETAIYALAAIWLEAAGRPAEAAVSYYEAGRRFSWDGQPDRAVDLLSLAHALAPRHQAICFQLADAWLMRSFLTGPPYVESVALAHGLDAWNAGAALGPVDDASAWALLSRALLGEQRGRLRQDERVALLWEAVVYVERALLFDSAEARRWGYLGHMYRFLELEAAAVHATAEAIQRGADDPVALEERAAILANIGESDEAADAIERRLAQDPGNLWARGVKAFILMQKRDYAGALALIDAIVAAEPDNLWNLDVRATCQRMLGQAAPARQTYETIWRALETRSDLVADERRMCAFAAYKLGRLDDAIRLLESSVDDPLEQAFTLRALGLAWLAKGEPTRAAALLDRALARANARELEDFLHVDLADAEAMLSASGAAATLPAVEVLTAVRRKAAARLAELRRDPRPAPPTAAALELSRTLESVPAAAYDGWPHLAAHAGLARLLLGEERWVDAAIAYDALARTGRFPEAARGIDQAVEAIRSFARSHIDMGRFADAVAAYERLLALETRLSRPGRPADAHEELAGALWKAGRDRDALEHFRQALALLPAGASPERKATLHARVGLARQREEDRGAALASYLEALRAFSHAGLPDPGGALGDACRPQLRGVREYWTVDAEWLALARDTALGAAVCRQFAGARATLIDYLHERFGLETYPARTTQAPVVTPIGLEVGSVLVPQVDPQSDGGRFLYEDIPAMRQRIERSTGVRLPGIRVRDTAVEGPDYVILLDEVPAARGAVRGSRYCRLSAAELEAMAVAGPDVVQVEDPTTGAPGCWCSRAQAEILAAAALPTMTGTQFVLAHVESVLRNHLSSFLGVQEAHAFATSQKGEADKAPVEAWLAEPPSRLAFARVLRALVADGVPLTDWPPLVETLRASGLSNVDEAVDAARLRMKSALPGNDGAHTLARIPVAWERRLQAADGQVVVSPAAAHRMLVALRRWLHEHEGPVALVTSTARLRRLVRRLAGYEFPSVAVLTSDELIVPERVVELDDSESGLDA